MTIWVKLILVGLAPGTNSDEYQFTFLYCSENVELIDSRCQFHQRFYVQIFHTNIISASFSSYVLALAKNLYKKRAHKTLMKLMVGHNNLWVDCKH